MSVCRFCGQSAGWFSDAHDACTQKAEQGAATLEKRVADAIVQGKKYDDVKDDIQTVKSACAIPQDQFLVAFKKGWTQGVEKRCVAEPVSGIEFEQIGDFYRGVGITTEEMRSTHGFQTSVLSFLIWTVLNDEIEPYNGPIHFNLSAGEVPVFGIANVLVSEERTTRSYVGGYGGVSVRIASGLYYRLGATRGHREDGASVQEVDYGDFLMTTEGIYFGGREHGVNFKIPYKQIVRFNPYSDAVGICKDGAKEKILAPQHVLQSGWFLFNILQALAAKNSQSQTHHRP
jgi:hypothetical protein